MSHLLFGGKIGLVIFYFNETNNIVLVRSVYNMSWKANLEGSAIKSLATPKKSRRASSGLFKFQFDSATHHSKHRNARQSIPRGGKRWSGQGSAPLKDTRNLSNRGLQRKLVEELISFLQDINYPHPISSKQLQAPTKKECEKLFAFLFDLLTPNQKVKKLEDDVPKLLKQLKYPFPISKSIMFSIGSSHSWPTMLGALHWLMELIKYCSNVSESGIIFQNNADDGQEIEQVFLDYCSKSFLEHIEDSSVPTRDEAEDLFKHLIDKTGLSEKENEEIRLRAQLAEEDLKVIESEPNHLQLAQEKRTMLQEECENFERAIIELTHKRSAMRQKRSTLESELRELEINPESGTQVSQLEAGNQQNRIAMEKLTSEKERIDSSFWDKQMEYSKLYAKADESLQDYQDICRQLSGDKTIQKLLGNRDITMTMGDTDMSGQREEILRELQSKLCEVVNSTEAERISEESKLEQLVEMAAEKQDRQSQLQAKIAQIEKELEFKIDSMAKEHKYLTELVSKLEMENEKLEHGGQALMKDKEREFLQLKEEIKKKCEDFSRQEDNYEFFVRKVVEMVSQHHTALQTRWSEIGEDAEEDLRKLNSITPPQSKLLKTVS